MIENKICKSSYRVRIVKIITIISFLFSFEISAQELDSKIVDDQIIKYSNSKLNLLFSYLLIGDTGEPKISEKDNSIEVDDVMLLFLKDHIENIDTPFKVALLGDNLYPSGLTKKTKPKLDAQLEVLKSMNDRRDAVFVPGNHDYKKLLKAGGRKRAQKQFDYVTGKGFTFSPEPNSTGADKIAYQQIVQSNSDKIGFVTIDTEWFLNHWWWELWSKSKREEEFFDKLEDVLKKDDDYLIMTAHHPIYSVGKHGIKKKGIGTSIWTFFSKQDLINKKYQKWVTKFKEITGNYDKKIIYVAGHDHNLQLFQAINSDDYFVVSGGGSYCKVKSDCKKVKKAFREKQVFDLIDNRILAFDSLAREMNWISEPNENLVFDTSLESKDEAVALYEEENDVDLHYSRSLSGFARIDFYMNEVWMSFYSPESTRADGVIFAQRIYKKKM